MTASITSTQIDEIVEHLINHVSHLFEPFDPVDPYMTIYGLQDSSVGMSVWTGRVGIVTYFSHLIVDGITHVGYHHIENPPQSAIDLVEMACLL